LMDDPRIVLWKALYEEAAAGLNGLMMKGRLSGPLISRVSGATP